MSPAGRPSPPLHVWLYLGLGLFMFGRGVQDIAAGLVTGITWFRLGAAAWLAWSAIRDWQKFKRRQPRQMPPPAREAEDKH